MSITAMKQALDASWKCRNVSIESGAYESYRAVREAFNVLDEILRQAIEQAEKQKIEAIARVDDLERGGRVRALALGLGLDEILYARINHEPN